MFKRNLPSGITKVALSIVLACWSVSTSSAWSAPLVAIGASQDNADNKDLSDFAMNYNRQDKIVTFIKKDGTAKAFVQIMPAAAHLSTTKAYAQNVMDSYGGWGLSAQIERRGFSFKYVDNAPCSGLVSYFDGTSYLMMGACGFISEDEVTKAFFLGKKELKIDESLYRSAKPSSYY